VGQQLNGKFGSDGIAKAQEFIEQSSRSGSYVPQTPEEWDIQCILTVIFSLWRMHFRFFDLVWLWPWPSTLPSAKATTTPLYRLDLDRKPKIIR